MSAHFTETNVPLVMIEMGSDTVAIGRIPPDGSRFGFETKSSVPYPVPLLTRAFEVGDALKPAFRRTIVRCASIWG